MKKILISIGLVAASSTLIFSLVGCSKNGASAGKSNTEKVSYIIGYNIGRNFKAQGVNLNVTHFARGLKDGFTGIQPAISQKDMQAILKTFQDQLRTKMVKKYNDASATNAKASADYMAQLAKESAQSGSKIKLLASGVYYEVITAGNGKTPKLSDTVTVNYEGTLINGTVFDSTYKTNKPITFKVSEVIKGWKEALLKMPVGSSWKIYISPEMGYGKMAPPVIGPDQVLVFKVDLLGIKK